MSSVTCRLDAQKLICQSSLLLLFCNFVHIFGILGSTPRSVYMNRAVKLQHDNSYYNFTAAKLDIARDQRLYMCMSKWKHQMIMSSLSDDWYILYMI